MISGILSAMVVLLAPAQAEPSAPTQYFVSTNGDDGWSGVLSTPNAERTDGPFATLERARDAVRALKQEQSLPDGGIAIVVRGGRYELAAPFALNAEDAGTETAPILYAAMPGEEVRLSGGKAISDFATVDDPGVLSRLDETAREHVRVADLKAQGITDYGPADAGGIEFFYRDQPMRIARWPNEGFVRIADIVVDDGHTIHGAKGSKVGKFKYEGDRPARWQDELDPWLHGYWFWDWSDQRQRIADIDTGNNVITLEDPPHGYGYRKGQWYYAFNMLSELDAPGEWYLDRDNGLFYFWPPESLNAGDVVASVSTSVITLDGASHVGIRGFTVEMSRGVAVALANANGNEVIDCRIRNAGGSAVSVQGVRSGVRGCEIYDVGEAGISLNGGDRTTLERGDLFAVGNHIHHYGRIKPMYNAGVAMFGVGLRAANNLIHTAPHMGIFFGGNDHVIEYNELHHVCEESNDAGAMYAGRDWLMRGNVIRYNYLHEINGFEDRGCVGVYLDDMFSSAEIYGNVFYDVTRAAFIGGGRDCTIENNIFVDCSPALHIDARALGWAGYHADEWIVEANEKGTIKDLKWNAPPYSDRYPELLTLIDDEPKAPKGNLIARNICAGGKWDEIEDAALPYQRIEDNLIVDDPGFVDGASKDFRLKEDSPAWDLGFKAIPIERIGLLENPVEALGEFTGLYDAIQPAGDVPPVP